MHDIELNIEELSLKGFPPEQHDEIRGAFHGELTRLLNERGVPAIARNESGAQSAPAKVERSSPHGIGVEAARTTYGRMTR